MQNIINWANQNQGVLAIILFLISLGIGWTSGFFKWIAKKLFHKDTTPFISAGRDIKAGGDIIVGNKKFVQKSGKGSRNIQGEHIIINKYDDDK